MSAAPKSKGLKILAQEKFAQLAEQIRNAKGNDLDDIGTPPIMIMSDGTVEGTHLMLHGQPVTVDSLHFGCSKGEFGYCDMSITQRSEVNGMERTLTLRKHTEVN